jgi:GNAT superfamily N-acetyltransferase
MQRLQIEIAKASDLPSIMRLISQPDMSPDNRLTEEEVFAFYERLRSNPWHELYVVRQEEPEIIGTLSILGLPSFCHNGDCSLIIEDVVVKTELQGKGIGRRMMEFAIERGRELKCSKLILSSGAKRTDAHSFYESLGFRKHGITFYLPMQNEG